MTKELLQMYMRDTFAPVDQRTLTRLQMDKALELLLLLEEKRLGKVKGSL